METSTWPEPRQTFNSLKYNNKLKLKSKQLKSLLLPKIKSHLQTLTQKLPPPLLHFTLPGVWWVQQSVITQQWPFNSWQPAMVYVAFDCCLPQNLHPLKFGQVTKFPSRKLKKYKDSIFTLVPEYKRRNDGDMGPSSLPTWAGEPNGCNSNCETTPSISKHPNTRWDPQNNVQHVESRVLETFRAPPEVNLDQQSSDNEGELGFTVYCPDASLWPGT